jgi:hypothetical protein
MAAVKINRFMRFSFVLERTSRRANRGHQKFHSADPVDVTDFDLGRLNRHLDVGQKSTESLGTEMLFGVVPSFPLHKVRERVLFLGVLQHPTDAATFRYLGGPLQTPQDVQHFLEFIRRRYNSQERLYHAGGLALNHLLAQRTICFDLSDSSLPSFSQD